MLRIPYLKPQILLVLVLGCLAAGAAHSAELLHRYSFGGDADDSVGTADGTLMGGAVISGGAVVLDGVDDFVDLPNNLFTSLNDITVEAWLIDDGSGTWSRIFDFGNSSAGEGNAGSGTEYMFLSPQAGNGVLRFAITSGSGEQLVDWPGTRLPVGVLTHVVWTYDRAAETGRLYVEGSMVGENTSMTIAPPDMGNTLNNWIGRSQWSADPFFLGSITEFRIYDGALTGTEVVDNFSFGPNVVVSDGGVELIEEPQGQTVDERQPVTFSVTYSGTPPVSVQWYRNGESIASATNDDYSIPAVPLSDHGASFHAVVSNIHSGSPYSDTSSNAVLTVNADLEAPTLVRSSSLYPNGVLVEFSESVTFGTATDISNYAISHAGGTLTVTGAAFVGDDATVELTTAGQTLGTEYTLTVNHVRDLSAAANEITANSQATFTAVTHVLDDIGSPTPGGTMTPVSGGYDITAGGNGIVSNSDQFSFVHKTYSGDFDVQVRLANMDFGSAWARAGLMARDGLAEGAVFAGIFSTSGPAGSHFYSRPSVGSAAIMQGSFPGSLPDMWLRLRRSGDLFEGFVSLDGQSWQLLGSMIISMPTAVEVGFALTSGEAGSAVTAGFRDESTGSGSIVPALALPFEPMGPCSRRTAMVISEIMYDPPSDWGGTNSMEFVEIWNSGLVTEDLTGHRFSGEIDYVFPVGTLLAPGEFLLVARDPAAAQNHYAVPFLGPYDGKLANNGGRLRLRNELGGILLEVEYDDRAPWPVSPNGAGHSLVLSRPSYGENDARAWAASDRIGGSPGTADGYGAEPARGVVINEFLAHTDLPSVDFIELFNTGNQEVDLGGAWLSDEAGTNKYRIADGTTVPGRGFRAFDQTELGFALSADGEQIFLVNSNRTRVLDAVDFRGQANATSSGRHPDGTPGFQELSAVTRGYANAAPRLRSVVINEIMYHPVSESNDDEYIEIYNRSANPLDLSNWRIQGGVSYTFPSNTVVGGHGYVVVAENATNLVAKYAQLDASNTFGNYRGNLNNRSERIALSMPEDLITTNALGHAATNIFYIVVDEVTYLDGGRWGQWSDGGGSSLELIDPGADNRLAANWADSDETAKAAWTTIDVTDILENGQSSSVVDEGNNSYGIANRFEMFLQGAGEVVVDDVEFRNNGGGNLVANGSFSSGAGGWTLGGVVRESFVESGVGTGGSAALHLVSVDRGDTGPNKAWHALSSTASTGGSNAGTIRARVRWLKGSPHMLLRVRGNWMEASLRLDVPADCGTPGQANSTMVSNAGPALYEVTHAPILPASGEDVVVTARATDPDGVGNVTLRYRVDPSSSHTSVTMRDDGTGGDAVAGDGLYSGTLPGRADDTLVAFHISATDGSASTRFPEETPDRECLVHWGEEIKVGGVGTYRMWLTEDNISFWTSREKNANDPIDATFIYGNSRVIYNVDTLYSGSPFHAPAYNGPTGSFPCDYEINFESDERFLGSEPFVVTAESISGGFWFDTSTQVDLTGTWIGRELGLQYNYRRHVHMVVNGDTRGSIYLDTQQPNGEMLDEYFPNDTQEELRKIESWFEFADDGQNQGSTYARIGRVDDADGDIDTTWYRWNWRPRATRDHDNWFAFTNMIAAVNDTGAADYEARVRTWVDVRNFVLPIAVHHICGSWDSYGYDRGKNMYAYKPDNEGWRLLMWDIELALGNGTYGTTDSIYWTRDNDLFNMITSVPAFERTYLQAFQEAVDTTLAPGMADVLLDERFENLGRNRVRIGSPQFIKDFIAGRRSYLQGVLPSATFSVNTPPSPVGENQVVLTGSAPLQVFDILVNGIPYPVEWTSVTQWSVTVPLAAGPNSLQVTGVDRFGDEVPGAGALVNVTCTGSDVDPGGYVVFSEIHPSPEARGLQFVELYNRHADFTFDLSNWRINGLGHVFPAGSLLGPRDYLLLVKDRFTFSAADPSVVVFDTYDGALDPDGETLTLFRPGALPGEEIVVDRVRYEQAEPWPAAVNGSSLQLVDAGRDNGRVANWTSTAALPGGVPVNVIDITHTWKYDDTGTDLGTDWRQPGYNDGSWADGPALLYYESASLPAPKSTELDWAEGKTTYYFRTTFTYGGRTAGATLDLSTVVDDGVVLYLNGQEIYRLGVPGGTVTYGTLANRVIGDAQFEGPFTIPATGLLPGENVLAAEVHQQAADSSDVTFGITLDVTPGPVTPTTPGAANSVASSLPAFPDIWLNELQAVNTTGPQDNHGDHDPWIELYNAGSSAFSLDGYTLTDTYADLTRWAFPAGVSIPAGGFLVVWCDAEPGESAPDVPHTDFTLASSVGQVALVREVHGAPQVVDYLNYTNLPSNYSYGDVPDGQPFYRRAMFYETPGATNDASSAPLTVVINEWMADNDFILSDPADGNYEDWFELYNPGPDTADLGGFFLTDDLTNDLFQFEIPDNGHYTIPPGGYLLVWADNESGQNATNRQDLHVNFALSRNGDSIALVSADGTIIDAVTFGPQATDVSEGRFPDGAAGSYTLAVPTPGYGNQVPNTAPSLDPIPDYVITLGQTLNFTAGATDTDTPQQMLTYSLSGEPGGATIGSANGAFSWTPTTAANTNTMAVVVTDDGTPSLDATEWFTVVVLAPPEIGAVTYSGTDVIIGWPSEVELAYQVYFKEDLREVYWNPVGGVLVGTGDVLNHTNSVGDLPECFFVIGVPDDL